MPQQLRQPTQAENKVSLYIYSQKTWWQQHRVEVTNEKCKGPEVTLMPTNTKEACRAGGRGVLLETGL